MAEKGTCSSSLLAWSQKRKVNTSGLPTFFLCFFSSFVLVHGVSSGRCAIKTSEGRKNYAPSLLCKDRGGRAPSRVERSDDGPL